MQEITMTPDRWEAVMAWFNRAVTTDGASRTALLDEAERTDPGLRRELEALLEADDAAGEFLEQPAPEMLAEHSTITVPSLKGKRIGPYLLQHEIGQGGMGIVYLAERADGAYQQTVALKLVRHDFETEEIHRRFRNERQILARLEHPHIARLLDGGTTDEGRPWLAMEYIEGEPITTYCTRQQLSIDERLRLFQSVCSAVQYAHKHFIIHRDLKPGNLLVTKDGVPKLLDFGIARLLVTDPLAPQDSPTTKQPLLTPDYASPEQVRGELINVTSDVYSLGVVLYELLTGVRPTQSSLQADAQSPEKPSLVASRSEIPASRTLRGDLDDILLKALRPEPKYRYASVEQFSEDIQRYLERLPVLARKGSLVYRTKKLMQRQRSAVMASVLTILVLGVVGLSIGASRTWFGKNRQAQLSGNKQSYIEPHNQVRRGTNSDEVWQYYLVGREAWRKRTEPDIRYAISCYSLTIQRDPNFALGYAGLADCYVTEQSQLPRLDSLRKAKELSQQALALDPTLPEAHTSLAFAKWRLDFDWDGAEQEFKRALELNNDYITANHWYGLLLMMQGRFPAAEERLLKAQQLDPSAHNIAMDLLVFYECKRDYNRVIELAKKMLAENILPNNWRGVIGMNLARMGRVEEALAQTQNPGTDYISQIYALTGRREEAEEMVRKRLNSALPAPNLVFLATHNLRDEAFAELEKIYAEHGHQVFILKVSPRFDRLRDDPRYNDLLRRVGLTP